MEAVDRQGESVSLRPARSDDLPLRVQWINDPEVNQWFTFRPTTIARTQRWFDIAGNDPDRVDFSVLHGAAGTTVGMGGFIGIDRTNRCAEVYLTVGDTRVQGRGVGAAALSLLVEHGLGHLHLHRIQMTTLAFNRRSRRLYESAGFTYEGTKREAYLRGDRFHDLAMYALVRP